MKHYSIEEFYNANHEDLGVLGLLGFKEVIIDDNNILSLVLETNKTHMNMHGTVQGGIQYITCDTAIGAQIVHMGRPGVGMEGSIQYYRPVKCGDTLTATVYPRKVGRRTGNFFVELKNQDGKLMAEARYSTMFEQ